MPPRVIHWFRTDLRLHDNPALQAALDLKPECLYPIFCFDPRYAYSQLVGVNRWQFLLDSLQNLSDNLTKTNPATQLFVVRGPPTTILPALFKAWRITHLCFEEDDDEYTMERDREVVEAAKAAGVEVVSKLGHTLWDANIILAQQ
jgi:cryptochrome